MDNKLRAEVEGKARAFDRKSFADETRKLREALPQMEQDGVQLLREDRDR